MLQACRDGDISRVRALVSQGGDVNITDSFNHTPLMYSLLFNKPAVSTYLLSLGCCDLHVCDTDGATALHYACAYNASTSITDSIARHSTIQQVNRRDNNNWSALDTAVLVGNKQGVRALSGLPGLDWDMEDLVGLARQGHEKGYFDAEGQRKYLSAEELESMLALLEEVDRERKASEAGAEEREAEKKREEERNKQAESEKKREKERKRQAEAEKKSEEERKRRAEAEKNAEILRQREKRRQEEEEKQNEMKRIEEQERQKYLVDESDFATMCRVSEPDYVCKCLEYNPSLLNCMSGQPLREAVTGENLPVMDTLMNRKGIDVNLKNDYGLSALHIGTSLDQPHAVRKLLAHPGIEVNPISKKGLTPIKLATENGKIEALKVLLEDTRTNFREVNEEGKALEDLLGTGLNRQLGVNDTAEARRLFHQARNRSNSKNRRKTVIFVLNSDYSKANMDSLHGQHDDFKTGKKVFKDKHYEVRVIKDSDDILGDVCTLIKEEKIKESASDVFQLVYSGHGVHKAMVEKGREAAENDEEKEFKQKGKLGDCLVNTDGTFCSELELALKIANELSEKTRICLFYDMCRNQSKQGQKKEFLKIDNFKLKKEFEDTGADRRTVRVYAAKLGQLSKDIDSFFHRICHEIDTSSPSGLKFSQMKNFERKSQNCKIEGDLSEDWGEQWWPLL